MIALAKVDLLAVLNQLYGQTVIPSAVHDELFVKDRLESERLRTALSNGYLHVIVPRWLPDIPLEVESRTKRLGRGEREAIGLVFQLRGLSDTRPPGLLLIDDQAARTVANDLGIPVTGVVGILVRAKQDGCIQKLRPVLESIHENGY